MLKKSKLFISLVVIILSVIALVACNNDLNQEYTLEVADKDAAFSMVQGEIDALNNLVFKQVDKDGKTVAEVKANASMLSPSDLDLLRYAHGTYFLEFSYQNHTVSVSITILPSITATNFTLTFDAGEGKFPAEVSGAKETSTKIITTDSLPSNSQNKISKLPIPQRKNYDFLGWYKSAEFDGNPIGAPYTITYDHTLYAKWVFSEKCTLTFINDLDTPNRKTETIELGSTITLPTAINVVGYKFLGWEYNNDIYASGTSVIVNADANIVAKYQRIQYTLTLRSEMWLEEKQIKVDYNSNYNIEPVPVKQGHIGVWLDASNNEAPKLTNITSNITIYAKYSPRDLIVRFLEDDNSVIKEERLKYGERVLTRPVVNREGYTHEWVYNNNGRWELATELLNNPIKDNIDIVARYTIKRYNLTYIYSGKTKTLSYDYNTKISEADIPADIMTSYPAKYFTVTWYTANNTQDPEKRVVFPITIKENSVKTIYAYIKENDYKVDFYLPKTDVDGTPLTVENFKLETKSVKKGGKITPPIYSSEKYEIIGWVDKNNNVVNLNDIQDFHEYNSNPEKDQAVYAKVQIKTYDITFYNLVVTLVDNKYVYTNVEIETHNNRYGTVYNNNDFDGMLPYNLDLLTAPSYPDQEISAFVFDGWYADASYKTGRVDFAGGYTVNQKVSFYAKWLDADKGTEGLEFSPLFNDNNEIIAYALTGFEPIEDSYPRVLIPYSYEGRPVTHIAKTAFENSYGTTIESIEFGVNIESIEQGAFYTCATLLSFGFIDNIVPDNFIIDEFGVLYSRDGMLISYPASLENTSYTIPSALDGIDIIKIADSAFSLNNYLITLTFDDASVLTEIGNYAFYSSSMLSIITLPDSLVKIGDSAFEECKMLSKINHGSDIQIEIIGKKAFAGTAWYMKKDNDVLMLGNVLIKYIGSDVELNIADSVVAIANDAFTTTEAHLPLTTVRFSSNSSLKIIGESAFNTANLKNVYILTTEPVVIADCAFRGISMDATLYVDISLVDYYNSIDYIVSAFTGGIKAI